MQSGGGMEIRMRFTWAVPITERRIWTHSGSREDSRSPFTGHSPLDRLRKQIMNEIDFYRSKADHIDSVEREKWVEAFCQWLDSEGKAIIEEINGKILVADASTREKMCRSINAAQRRLQFLRKRDLEKPETLDLIWEWVVEVLPSLRRAFRRFGSLDEEEEVSAPMVLEYDILTDCPTYVGEGIEVRHQGKSSLLLPDRTSSTILLRGWPMSASFRENGPSS